MAGSDLERRQRRGASEWSAVLSRFAVSGLSVVAFCEREGFSTASFYRWRGVLGGTPEQGGVEYVRPVVKVRATQAISCPPAPLGVIEGSRADVSFLAGLLVDKFLYHLPFYRIHQRLTDVGFTLSRPWLTQLGQQAASLLEPIYEAQLASIRRSRVLAMDETPIKAGRAGTGKMKQGYFWPVYGEAHEMCFPYCESRRAEHVWQVLGMKPPPGAVLLTDGYAAYARYTAQTGLTHAQCWAHYPECRFIWSRRPPTLAQRQTPPGPCAVISPVRTPHKFCRSIKDDRRVGEWRCNSRSERSRTLRVTSRTRSGVRHGCPPVPCTRQAAVRLLAMAATRA